MLRATLGGGGTLVRGHEVTHSPCLIGQLGRHDRSLGRVGDDAEHIVAASRLDGRAGFILLPAHKPAAIIAHGNLDRLPAAFRHQNQVDAEAVQAPRFLERLLQRVVCFTVGEQHQHAVSDFGARVQQIDALRESRGERRATFRGDVGIERVEVEGERRAIHRQRRQDVARPSEDREAEPVAVQILHQTARLPQSASQAARLRVLRQHGPRDVDRQHEIETAGFGDDALFAPARSRQRHRRQGRGKSHGNRCEGSRRARDARRSLGPGSRPAHARASRPGSSGPDRAAHHGREGDDDRSVERDHGTRTANVPATTTSSASASSPRLSGQRYASS